MKMKVIRNLVRSSYAKAIERCRAPEGGFGLNI